MSKEQWQVNEGTQVSWGGKLHAAGDTFSATADEITAEGVGAYVTKVRQQAQPKAANKAVAAPEPHKATAAADRTAESGEDDE